MRSFQFVAIALSTLALLAKAQSAADIIEMNNCIAHCPSVNPEAESCYIACIDTHYVQKQHGSSSSSNSNSSSSNSKTTVSANNNGSAATSVASGANNVATAVSSAANNLATAANNVATAASNVATTVSNAINGPSTTVGSVATNGVINGNSTNTDPSKTSAINFITPSNSVLTMEESSAETIKYSMVAIVAAIIFSMF